MEAMISAPGLIRTLEKVSCCPEDLIRRQFAVLLRARWSIPNAGLEQKILQSFAQKRLCQARTGKIGQHRGAV